MGTIGCTAQACLVAVDQRNASRALAHPAHSPTQRAPFTPALPLAGRLRASWDGLSVGAQRRLPVAVTVHAALGEPLRVTLTDEQARPRCWAGSAGCARRWHRCACLPAPATHSCAPRTAGRFALPTAREQRPPADPRRPLPLPPPSLPSGVQGRSGTGATDVPAEPASGGRPLGPAEVQKAVGQNLGGEAPLAAASWDLSGCRFDSSLFVPGSAVKEARRRAVAALLGARQAAAAGMADGLQEGDVLAGMLAAVRAAGSSSADTTSGSSNSGGESSQQAGAAEAAGGPEAQHQQQQAQQAPVLRVLCRSKAQVDAALVLPWLQEVVLDFLEVRTGVHLGCGRGDVEPGSTGGLKLCHACSHSKSFRPQLLLVLLLPSPCARSPCHTLSVAPCQVHGLKEACAAVRAAGLRAVDATPRVLKPDEQRLWVFYLRLGADALLLRRWAGLGGPAAGCVGGWVGGWWVGRGGVGGGCVGGGGGGGWEPARAPVLM